MSLLYIKLLINANIMPLAINPTFPFKLAIFDLDLTLWDGCNLYADIHSILQKLKSEGIRMYIASYNTAAIDCCKMLGIDGYFNGIYYTLYHQGATKLNMILEILQNNSDIKDSEVVFFDDHPTNIKDIGMATKIKSIHIDRFGLSWIHVPIKFIEKYTFDDLQADVEMQNNVVRMICDTLE